jgi:hypothetical protein
MCAKGYGMEIGTVRAGYRFLRRARELRDFVRVLNAKRQSGKTPD